MNVYRINDYYWYMAKTLKEAIQAASDDCGLPLWDTADKAAVLSESEMSTLIYTDVDNNDKRISFAEHLAKRINDGDTEATCFASTEY